MLNAHIARALPNTDDTLFYSQDLREHLLDKKKDLEATIGVTWPGEVLNWHIGKLTVINEILAELDDARDKVNDENDEVVKSILPIHPK